MDEACSTYGIDKKFLQNFGRKNLEERDHSEDKGVSAYGNKL
jgi:hypothetical protein